MEEKIIKQVLRELGIPTSLKGFKFIIYIIQEIINKENYKITDIYTVVAKKHKTNGCCVERAIRHSLCRVNSNAYFDVDYKICNKEFIELIKERCLELSFVEQ